MTRTQWLEGLGTITFGIGMMLVDKFWTLGINSLGLVVIGLGIGYLGGNQRQVMLAGKPS